MGWRLPWSLLLRKWFPATSENRPVPLRRSTQKSRSVVPLPDCLYFATDDLDATMDRAGKAGADITASIGVMPWGERLFYCSDPDGHQLCFVDDTTLFLGGGAAWS